MPVEKEDIERFMKFKRVADNHASAPNEKDIANKKMQEMILENPAIKDVIDKILKKDGAEEARKKKQDEEINRKVNEDIQKERIRKEREEYEKKINPFFNTAGKFINSVGSMYVKYKEHVESQSRFKAEKKEIEDIVNVDITGNERTSTITIKVPTKFIVDFLSKNKGKEFEAAERYGGAIFEIAKNKFIEECLEYWLNDK